MRIPVLRSDKSRQHPDQYPLRVEYTLGLACRSRRIEQNGGVGRLCGRWAELCTFTSQQRAPGERVLVLEIQSHQLFYARALLHDCRQFRRRSVIRNDAACLSIPKPEGKGVTTQLGR